MHISYEGKSRKRTLPQCDKPITVNYIKNKESRFANRKRPDGWLTPTARNLLDTTLNTMDKIGRILPIRQWCIEYNIFAFMKAWRIDIY